MLAGVVDVTTTVTTTMRNPAQVLKKQYFFIFFSHWTVFIENKQQVFTERNKGTVESITTTRTVTVPE